MGALSHDHIDVVRALIETAPDSAVRELETALKGDLAGQGLAAVRALIDAEVWDRNVRDAVFAPLLPLLAPRPDGFEQTQFPAAVLPRLWRVLKESAPTPAALALASLTAGADSEGVPPAYDRLCREAAAGLQGSNPAFAPVIEFLESFRPGAAAQFAGFLAVTPIARGAVQRLPGWIRQMTNDSAAAIRLMYRDAVQISEDGGPRLVEMLLAQLREPWMVLRVICAVTNKVGDRYLSSSEMAFFGERILGDIDAQLNRLRAFDPEGGSEGGVAAAKALSLAVAAAAEFEGALELDKEGVWGKRLSRQKGVLASLAEGYLKKCGKLVGDALPMQPVRVGGAILRNEPNLTAMPQERPVRRAMAGLTFFDKVRVSAPLGGYGVVRGKVCEEITHGLDTYVEDVLAMLHAKEAADVAVAHAYLEVVAEFMGLVQGQKAAQIVRRRAAAV
jgi:hypothetical protein